MIDIRKCDEFPLWFGNACHVKWYGSRAKWKVKSEMQITQWYNHPKKIKEYFPFISQHDSAIQYQNVVFTVQTRCRKWLLFQLLIKYIHLHLYTSDVNIFASPAQKTNKQINKTNSVQCHCSSHLCLKYVSEWRGQEWESLN